MWPARSRRRSPARSRVADRLWAAGSPDAAVGCRRMSAAALDDPAVAPAFLRGASRRRALCAGGARAEPRLRHDAPAQCRRMATWSWSAPTPTFWSFALVGPVAARCPGCRPSRRCSALRSIAACSGACSPRDGRRSGSRRTRCCCSSASPSSCRTSRRCCFTATSRGYQTLLRWCDLGYVVVTGGRLLALAVALDRVRRPWLFLRMHVARPRDPGADPEPRRGRARRHRYGAARAVELRAGFALGGTRRCAGEHGRADLAFHGLSLHDCRLRHHHPGRARQSRAAASSADSSSGVLETYGVALTSPNCRSILIYGVFIWHPAAAPAGPARPREARAMRAGARRPAGGRPASLVAGTAALVGGYYRPGVGFRS